MLRSKHTPNILLQQSQYLDFKGLFQFSFAYSFHLFLYISHMIEIIQDLPFFFLTLLSIIPSSSVLLLEMIIVHLAYSCRVFHSAYIPHPLHHSTVITNLNCSHNVSIASSSATDTGEYECALSEDTQEWSYKDYNPGLLGKSTFSILRNVPRKVRTIYRKAIPSSKDAWRIHLSRRRHFLFKRFLPDSLRATKNNHSLDQKRFNQLGNSQYIDKNPLQKHWNCCFIASLKGVVYGYKMATDFFPTLNLLRE